MKSDQGKPRYDLIPAGALALVVQVFTYGTKYDKTRAPGWTKVKDWRSLYTAALMRHFESYRAGEYLDPAPGGSGLPHLAHVATNALILLALESRARTRKKV